VAEPVDLLDADARRILDGRNVAEVLPDAERALPRAP
jgi:hypothetical protein